MADHKIIQGNLHDTQMEVQEAKIKENVHMEENVDEKVAPPAMRSASDDLSVWEAVKRYQLITLVGMAAAFSASLDGYRESHLPARIPPVQP